MQPAHAKTYHLPWNVNDHYWISLFAKDGSLPPQVLQPLKGLGLESFDDCLAVKTGKQWKPVWDQIYTLLEALKLLEALDAAVTPGAMRPEAVPVEERALQRYQIIANSLWIGEALLDNRIVCYLQPVMMQKDKVFGYESFARVKGVNGELISGAQIVSASKVLGIEHMIDRHLHIETIKTFAASDFNGFLFINFFPGFIHRPAVYLEGLSDTAKRVGMLSKHIVLDFTNSETPRDKAHIKNVTDYCRSCGYSVAFDDVSSESSRKALEDIRPDFVKIDMALVRQVQDAVKRETIRAIVDIVHGYGGAVIAEGVESAEVYEALKMMNVDLFQGYFFSPPVPVEAALKRASS